MAARKSGKKATSRKKSTSRRKAASEAGSKKAPAATKGATASKEKRVSSTAVNLGHVFALRPRVSSAFRQEDFLAARRLLEGEEYATIEEAARAVVERALSMTNDPKARPGARRGR
jgi:hypothetical protein